MPTLFYLGLISLNYSKQVSDLFPHTSGMLIFYSSTLQQYSKYSSTAVTIQCFTVFGLRKLLIMFNPPFSAILSYKKNDWTRCSL